jgi:hypothetical protein
VHAVVGIYGVETVRVDAHGTMEHYMVRRDGRFTVQA